MKKEITCIIVDDELHAQDLLCRHVELVVYLKLVGVCKSALDALEVVRNVKPDLVFLDINMPGISGMELVKMLGASRPNIIFTTGYADHAVESYDFGIIDYLVKPISFERFVRAVNKVSEKMDLSDIIQRRSGMVPQSNGEVYYPLDNFFMIKSERKLIKINIEEIVLIEGMRDYLKIHLKNSMTIVHMTLIKMEQILDKHQFIRINKSYIVNVREIKTIDGNQLELSNKRQIVIGTTFRESVLSNLEGKII